MDCNWYNCIACEGNELAWLSGSKLKFAWLPGWVLPHTGERKRGELISQTRRYFLFEIIRLGLEYRIVWSVPGTYFCVIWRFIRIVNPETGIWSSPQGPKVKYVRSTRLLYHRLYKFFDPKAYIYDFMQCYYEKTDL